MKATPPLSTHRILIVGAGPAGLSCALWLHKMGINADIIEKSGRLGGQLHWSDHANDWNLGDVGCTSRQLITKYEQHCQHYGITVRKHTELAEILSAGKGILNGDASLNRNLPIDVILRTSHGDSAERFTHVVLATGNRDKNPAAIAACALPRLLKGETAHQRMPSLSQQRLLIIGSGDNAFENAHKLALKNDVSVAVNSRPKARPDLVEAALQAGVRIVSSAADPGLEPLNAGIQATHIAPGERFDYVISLCGFTPGCHFDDNGIPCNKEGYVRTDRQYRSRRPRIYAIGDACDAPFPSIAHAIASGATAAKSIEASSRTRLNSVPRAARRKVL